MKIVQLLLASAVLLTAAPFAAGAVTLTNGSGDGDVEVDVSAFGNLFDAYFDPVGSVARGSTVFDSYVAMTQGSSLADLDELASREDAEATILSQTTNQLVTQFSINQLQFTLTQTVADAVESGAQTGSILTQQFQITNLTDVANTFDLYRYMDGDLYLTDDTLADGGGVIQQSGVTVLYETDLVDGVTEEDTFLGITAEGGTIPTSGRFSIADCCGIPAPLDDDVTNDLDNDGDIDQAYDVTLTLRNQFSIGAGQTASYTTATLFGNGEPPAPGSTESLAILPDRIEHAGDGEVESFFFDIPVQELEVAEVIWIDPVIAVGYTYEVTGAEFYSVTAPSLATVDDADGVYTLNYGTFSVTLAAGEEHVFASPVSMFDILGIDTGLELDPSDAAAFATGVAFTNIDPNATFINVWQTPITFDTDSTDPAPVPLPAPALLLFGGLSMLAGMRRLRHAA